MVVEISDRTDLLNAIQALSQLSYTPDFDAFRGRIHPPFFAAYLYYHIHYSFASPRDKFFFFLLVPTPVFMWKGRKRIAWQTLRRVWSRGVTPYAGRAAAQKNAFAHSHTAKKGRSACAMAFYCDFTGRAGTVPQCFPLSKIWMSPKGPTSRRTLSAICSKCSSPMPISRRWVGMPSSWKNCSSASMLISAAFSSSFSSSPNTAAELGEPVGRAFVKIAEQARSSLCEDDAEMEEPHAVGSRRKWRLIGNSCSSLCSEVGSFISRCRDGGCPRRRAVPSCSRSIMAARGCPVRHPHECRAGFSDDNPAVVHQRLDGGKSVPGRPETDGALLSDRVRHLAGVHVNQPKQMHFDPCAPGRGKHFEPRAFEVLAH